MIRFTFQGQSYTFDEDRLSVSEARQLKAATGLTVRAFVTGLREYDVDALEALVRLAKVRSGEHARVEHVVLPDWDLLGDLDVEAAEATQNGDGPVPTVGAEGSTSTVPPSKTSTPKRIGAGGSGRSRSTSPTPPTRSTP